MGSDIWNSVSNIEIWVASMPSINFTYLELDLLVFKYNDLKIFSFKTFLNSLTD